MSDSSEVRRQALQLATEGIAKKEVASLLGVDVSTVYRWIREAEGGQMAVSKRGRGQGRISYPSEVRRRALEIAAEGTAKNEVASLLGICHYTVCRWMREAGSGKMAADKPGPTRGESGILSERALRKAIKARPGARQVELARAFGVHRSAIHKALERYRISL